MSQPQQPAPESASAPQTTTSTAAEAFKQRLRDAFDAIPLGQTYTFRRTFTDGDVALFCGVTGDFNPYHLDDTFAAQSWFGRRIIPGLLTASMVTHIGGLIGFLAADMTFHYLAPVYIGDTITCTVTFTSKDPEKRSMIGSAHCANQHGRDVLTGTFSGFPADLRLAR